MHYACDNLQSLPVVGQELNVDAIHTGESVAHDNFDGGRIRHAIRNTSEGMSKAIKWAVLHACSLACFAKLPLDCILSSRILDIAFRVPEYFFPHQWLAVLRDEKKLRHNVGTPAVSVVNSGDSLRPKWAAAFDACLLATEPMALKTKVIATKCAAVGLTESTIYRQHDAGAKHFVRLGQHGENVSGGPKFTTFGRPSDGPCWWTLEGLTIDRSGVIRVSDPFHGDSHVANGIADSAGRTGNGLDDAIKVGRSQDDYRTLAVDYGQYHFACAFVPHVLRWGQSPVVNVSMSGVKEAVQAVAKGDCRVVDGNVCVCGELCPCEVLLESGNRVREYAEVDGFSLNRLIPLARPDVSTQGSDVWVRPSGFVFHARSLTQESSVGKIGSPTYVYGNKPINIDFPGVAQRLEPGTHKRTQNNNSLQNKATGDISEGSHGLTQAERIGSASVVPLAMGGQGNDWHISPSKAVR